MNAPGSPSSALQTTYLIVPGAFCVNSHEPGEETGPATPPQPRALNLVDHLGGRH